MPEEKKLKVFYINEYEWYVHFSLEEAIEAYKKNSGLTDPEDLEEAYELTETELNATLFHTDEYDKDGKEIIITFAEQLKKQTEPGFFAGTDW